MSFDRFFKVALLVVLAAGVLVYGISTMRRADAQVMQKSGPGTYQLVIDSQDRFWAFDTTSAQIYQLTNVDEKNRITEVYRWRPQRRPIK